MDRHFTPEQRSAIKRAGIDARERGGLHPDYDAVDLASDTGNYFWSHLTDRQARIALRYIYLVAR